MSKVILDPCYCTYRAADVLSQPPKKATLSNYNLYLLRFFVEGGVLYNKQPDERNLLSQEVDSIFDTPESERKFRLTGHSNRNQCLPRSNAETYEDDTFRPKLEFNPPCEVTDYVDKNQLVTINYAGSNYIISLQTMLDCFQAPLMEYITSDSGHKRKKTALRKRLNQNAPSIFTSSRYNAIQLDDRSLRQRMSFLTSILMGPHELIVLQTLDYIAVENFLSNVLQALCWKTYNVRRHEISSTLTPPSAKAYNILQKITDAKPKISSKKKVKSDWDRLVVNIPTLIIFHELDNFNDQQLSVITYLINIIQRRDLPVKVVVSVTSLAKYDRLLHLARGIISYTLQIEKQVDPSVLVNELSHNFVHLFGQDKVSPNKVMSKPIILSFSDASSDGDCTTAYLDESLLHKIGTLDRSHISALRTICTRCHQSSDCDGVKLENLLHEGEMLHSLGDIRSLVDRNLIVDSASHFHQGYVPSIPLIELGIATMLVCSGTKLSKIPESNYKIFIQGAFSEPDSESVINVISNGKYDKRVIQSGGSLFVKYTPKGDRARSNLQTNDINNNNETYLIAPMKETYCGERDPLREDAHVVTEASQIGSSGIFSMDLPIYTDSDSDG